MRVGTLSLISSISFRERVPLFCSPDSFFVSGSWLPRFGPCLWQPVTPKALSWPANDSGKRWLQKHRLGRLITWDSSLISDGFQLSFVRFIRFLFCCFIVSRFFGFLIELVLLSYYVVAVIFSHYWVAPPSRLFLSIKVAFLICWIYSFLCFRWILVRPIWFSMKRWFGL